MQSLSGLEEYRRQQAVFFFFFSGCSLDVSEPAGPEACRAGAGEPSAFLFRLRVRRGGGAGPGVQAQLASPGCRSTWAGPPLTTPGEPCRPVGKGRAHLRVPQSTPGFWGSCSLLGPSTLVDLISEQWG